MQSHRSRSLLVLVGSLILASCNRPIKSESSGISAVSSGQDLANGIYTIKSLHSDRCLDVPRSTTADDAVIWQYGCNGTDAQKWKVTQLGNGSVTITNVGNGKALDLKGAKEDGARLVQLPLDPKKISQHFSIEGNNGRLAIRSRDSNRVLDVLDFGTGDTVPIQQWGDAGSANQRWSFTKIDGSIPKPGTPTPPMPPLPPPPAPSGTELTIAGRQLLVGGVPFNVKSVCYNPVRKGQTHPAGLMFLNPSPADLAMLEKDFAMMREAGINTIRTYEAILDDRVLNLLLRYQLRVIVPVLNYYQASAARSTEIVSKLKGHPTTLIWEMGNEWNYNHLYGAEAGFSYDAAKNLVKTTAALVKNLDRSHPTATVYGELPPQALVNELGDIDIWGLNVYSGLTFGDRFSRWTALSGKPMYFGEFGADAINRQRIDVDSQALATQSLLKELVQNLSSLNPGNATIGGSIFEWNDEWWKDGKGSPAAQDVGGIAPGGGPYPDATFNEEYWGIVDIDRNPRPAYHRLKEAYSKY